MSERAFPAYCRTRATFIKVLYALCILTTQLYSLSSLKYIIAHFTMINEDNVQNKLFARFIATLSSVLSSFRLERNVNSVIGDTKKVVISTLHSVPVQVPLIYLIHWNSALKQIWNKQAESPCNSITKRILVSWSSFQHVGSIPHYIIHELTQ